MKKKPFITVETENLAVPEVHIDKEDVEETFELFFVLFSSILLDRPCLRKKAGPS